MTNSAAAFIEALQRRWRLNAHRSRPPGEFPEGWKTWLESMTQRVGAVTGARVEEVVGVLLARVLPMPAERAALLNRWQAFSTLWRQQWHPVPREERYVRWAAATFSVLVNLFFAVALIWLMYLQFLGLEPPPQGEQVVQVEFLGEGTPGEVGGGGGQASPTDRTDEAPSPQPRDAAGGAEAPAEPEAAEAEALPALPTMAVEAHTSPPELAGAPLEVPEREVAPPSAPAAPQEQPVAVSEPAPDTTEVFVLPPTRAVASSPRLTTRELQAKTSQMHEREVAAPVRANAAVIETESPAARPLTARSPQVVERDVVAPVQAPAPREVQVRSPALREITARTEAIREREVRTPSAPQAAVGRASAPAAASPQVANTGRTPAGAPTRPSSSAAPSGAPSSTPATSAATPGATTSAARAPSMAAATSPGAGPKAQPAPGTWAAPSRADDWGSSARNTPGAQRGVAPGVFNADGSVRVPDRPGSASPGTPPGTVTQEIANLDRAGTWLKRKPTDFESTSFDKYWVPNETLLAEWVRKSIKEVLIPIPGTNKRIRCAVALLALGGACALSDPNLNEQPATARPPPDVPFKPHLQEDNGSVRPGTPPGG